MNKQFVDFFHAVDHAGDVLEGLLESKQHPDYESRLQCWADRLLEDQVEELIAQSLWRRWPWGVWRR